MAMAISKQGRCAGMRLGFKSSYPTLSIFEDFWQMQFVAAKSYNSTGLHLQFDIVKQQWKIGR